MPRFYFNIREGNRLTRDEEGLDLPGLDAAQREAEMSGREILADMLRDGTPLDGQAVEITNEQGMAEANQPQIAVLDRSMTNGY